MRKPSESQLIGIRTATSRPFALPSCGACLRIAQRHGISHGFMADEGVVEGFTHADGEVQALLVNTDGFVVPVPLSMLEARRLAVISL